MLVNIVTGLCNDNMEWNTTMIPTAPPLGDIGVILTDEGYQIGAEIYDVIK